MKIQMPLQYAGALLNDDNMEQWNSLSDSEKLFYKYVLENDTTLSSVLLGIFTAYVVNLISNLVTLIMTDLFLFFVYIFNMIFAIRTLYFLVKLYHIHVMLEKQSEKNAISLRVNNDFRVLYKRRSNIADNVKMFRKNINGLFITLLLCFALNNGLIEIIHLEGELLREFGRELLKWIKSKSFVL